MTTSRAELVPDWARISAWDILVFYAPMVLWPPLLLAVTAHYLWRRTR